MAVLAFGQHIGPLVQTQGAPCIGFVFADALAAPVFERTAVVVGCGISAHTKIGETLFGAPAEQVNPAVVGQRGIAVGRTQIIHLLASKTPGRGIGLIL